MDWVCVYMQKMIKTGYLKDKFLFYSLAAFRTA